MSSGLAALNCYWRRPDSDDDELDDVTKGDYAGGGGAAVPAKPGKYAGNAWPPYPPPKETELEKAVRLEEEREAKLISDSIDRALEAERQGARRERKVETKILLLESGKSTMLKNFQIHFSPNALRSESDAWRAVIHLNLVRSVNFIIDTLTKPSPSSTMHGDGSPTVPAFSNRLSATPLPNSDLRRYKLTLSPLRQVEVILARYLSAKDATSPGERSSPVVQPQSSAAQVMIRGGHTWRALSRRWQDHGEEPHNRYDENKVEAVEDARHILDACREDVIELWNSLSMQSALRDEGVSLEDLSTFFLDEADRVMRIDYEPSFDDFLRARLQTTGVEEHHLEMETASWVPFFEDVNAIIFLCSTAGFNEVLAEDRNVNRLTDSFTTWKTICSSKLLASVQFILLLNKMDILDARLKAGIQFSDDVKGYKGENDLEHVTECEFSANTGSGGGL
ncbi:hypothetical protein BN946_scf185015.g3 [Trametes cinnabarina]|uniref:G-alpha-domain-containing protein n=1 Tax=Pycnoporus cinnabarinus TaxID=5643 RepID=A0A060SH01_PYCCI|nr:hypothetical protein BN946_scf185015.g3 [Trametes cinnabarina]